MQNRLLQQLNHLISLALVCFLLNTGVISAQTSEQGNGMVEEQVNENHPLAVTTTPMDGTTVLISWETASPQTGWVIYGSSLDVLDHIAYDERGQNTADTAHQVIIAGLQPDQTYYYAVVSGGVVYDNSGSWYKLRLGNLAQVVSERTSNFDSLIDSSNTDNSTSESDGNFHIYLPFLSWESHMLDSEPSQPFDSQHSDSVMGLLFRYDSSDWVPTLLADNGLETPDGVSRRTIGLVNESETAWIIIAAFNNVAELDLDQWIASYDYSRTGISPTYKEHALSGFPAVTINEAQQGYQGDSFHLRTIVSTGVMIYSVEYTSKSPNFAEFEQFLANIRFSTPTSKFSESSLSFSLTESYRMAGKTLQAAQVNSPNTQTCCGITDPEPNPFGDCALDGKSYGNCTWWVRYQRTGDDNRANLGACIHNANTWDECAAANYPDLLASSPSASAVAVFTGTNENHVQFVERVNSNGNYDISEMNYPTTCQRELLNRTRTTNIAFIQHPSDLDGGVIRSGQTLNETINPLYEQDKFFFDITQPQRVTIRMNRTSGDLDSYLTLYAPNGSVIANDDDGGGNLNSLINQTSLSQTGRYRITSRSFDDTTGNYSLSLTLEPPAPVCTPGTNGVVLYEHTYYGGRCATFTADDVDFIDNNFNDIASSIRFVGSYATGWEAVAYEHTYYGGVSSTFRADDADLNNDIVGNDRASSIRIRRIAPPVNLALNRPSFASSQQSSSYAPAKGNDGRTNTRWSSRSSSTLGDQWWWVDVGNNQTFDRVTVRWQESYAARYFIGWSNDGINFTGYWFSLSSAGSYNHYLGTQTARYVGMLMRTRASGKNNYSFWELEAYRTAALSAAEAARMALDVTELVADGELITITLTPDPEGNTLFLPLIQQ